MIGWFFREISMSKYRVGDIVRLKSGGPKMTVEVMQSRGFYTCSWFVRTEIKSWVFHENALMPVTDEKK